MKKVIEVDHCCFCSVLYHAMYFRMAETHVLSIVVQNTFKVSNFSAFRLDTGSFFKYLSSYLSRTNHSKCAFPKAKNVTSLHEIYW